MSLFTVLSACGPSGPGDLLQSALTPLSETAPAHAAASCNEHMAEPACLNLGCEWFQCPPTAQCDKIAWCREPSQPPPPPEPTCESHAYVEPCQSAGCTWNTCDADEPGVVCDAVGWCLPPSEDSCQWFDDSTACEENNCQWNQCAPNERCAWEFYCSAPTP